MKIIYKKIYWFIMMKNLERVRKREEIRKNNLNLVSIIVWKCVVQINLIMNLDLYNDFNLSVC